MSFGYDPEVPAGYQDADIEMAEMREAAIQEADEVRDREEEHKKWEREATSLDEQDLDELIGLVGMAFSRDILRRMVPVPELHRSDEWAREHPSQRMVALKNLEIKLIGMKAAL